MPNGSPVTDVELEYWHERETFLPMDQFFAAQPTEYPYKLTPEEQGEIYDITNTLKNYKENM